MMLDHGVHSVTRSSVRSDTDYDGRGDMVHNSEVFSGVGVLLSGLCEGHSSFYTTSENYDFGQCLSNAGWLASVNSTEGKL